MNELLKDGPSEKPDLIKRLLRLCLEKKIIVWLGVIVILVWGSAVAPFDWNVKGLPRDFSACCARILITNGARVA